MRLKQAKQVSKSRELGILLNSTLMQRRIVYSCLGVLNPIVPHLKDFSYTEVQEWIKDNGREAHSLLIYNIDIKEFASVWGIGGRSIYEKLTNSIGYDPKIGSSPEIMKMCFKYIGNNGDLEFINVVSKVIINKDSSSIQIKLTSDILPYLINLTSYISIPLEATVGFKCNYSFTMLEYLLARYSQRSTYPIIQLKLNTLQIALGTTHVKSYESWGMFKRSVLDKIERDFSKINGGGYDIKFEPIYEKAKMGRPKVESVQIHFNDVGFKKFLATKAAQKQGLDSAKNASSEAQQALKHYELEQQKQRDIKTSQEEFGF